VGPTLIAAAVLAAASCAACGCGEGGPAAERAGGAEGAAATLRRVTDGDTVVVAVRGTQERVRLVGIDTPEVSGPFTDEECFGPQASARTRALLAPGDPVRLVRDTTQDARDRNGRLLAYLYRPRETRSMNERLVAGGFARVYVVGRRFAQADRFEAAERAARAAGRGLWSACRRDAAPRPVPPPSSGACPPGRPVKGNLPSGIYHRPGDPDYAKTTPERCFATPADAERAGFRAARG
jgi:micrococcal nuclease